MSDIVVPSGWRDRLDEILGRRRQVWLVAGVVAAFAATGLLLGTRRAPAQIAPPAVAPPAVAPTVASQPAASAPPTGVVLVHIAGAVKVPGLYELPTGARVADVIDAAGGPRGNADLNAVNLAEVLVDASKIEVPRRGETPDALASAPATPATPSTTGDVAPVAVNSADLAQLETIPGIGPAKAQAIIDYRDAIGSFTSIDELLEVQGIGPATLEAIRPYVTL